MAKRTPAPEPPATTRLNVPAEEARTKLQERVTKGRELLARLSGIGSESQPKVNDYEKWSAYNSQLLRSLFSTDELVREYEWSNSESVYFQPGGHRGSQEQAYRAIGPELQCLESIIERLELYPEPETGSKGPRAGAPAAGGGQRVFIVHGHDDAARDAVARFLAQLGLEPVILNEQANRGKTIIEKLELYRDVGFAVVLLTPDDEGRAILRTDGAARPRARQNVVLELGYFMAHLTRERVCALVKDTVERPSDFDGVMYVLMDTHGAWRVSLARELRDAGFAIDASALL